MVSPRLPSPKAPAEKRQGGQGEHSLGLDWVWKGSRQNPFLTEKTEYAVTVGQRVTRQGSVDFSVPILRRSLGYTSQALGSLSSSLVD